MEHLGVILAEMQVATVRNQVALSMRTDFENYTTFAPGPHNEKPVGAMLAQVVAWTKALEPLRERS